MNGCEIAWEDRRNKISSRRAATARARDKAHVSIAGVLGQIANKKRGSIDYSRNNVKPQPPAANLNAGRGERYDKSTRTCIGGPTILNLFNHKRIHLASCWLNNYFRATQCLISMLETNSCQQISSQEHVLSVHNLAFHRVSSSS